MFDRKKFKYFAVHQLSGRWNVPVATGFIVMALTILFMSVYITIEVSTIVISSFSDTASSFSAGAAFGILIAMTVLLWIYIIINSIFQYATICMYLKMSYSPEPIKMGDFFYGFRYFGRAIGTYMWYVLWEFLWSLLFIIPGLIKNYAYSQIFYIAAENPKLSVRKSMKLSMIITKGYKWKLFVLDLTFVGWMLLSGLFTSNLGSIWIMPYMYLTKINAYHYIMQEAIESGKVPEEYLSDLSTVKPVKDKNVFIEYQQKLEQKKEESSTVIAIEDTSENKDVDKEQQTVEQTTVETSEENDFKNTDTENNQDKTE